MHSFVFKRKTIVQYCTMHAKWQAEYATALLEFLNVLCFIWLIRYHIQNSQIVVLRKHKFKALKALQEA